MGFSPPTFLLVALALWLPACGLFVSEPAVPSLADVANARAAEADDWALLESAWQVAADNPFDPLGELARLRGQNPSSVRLAIFEQDLQMQRLELAQVRSLAQSFYAQQPTALNAFLWARVAPTKELRDSLLLEALGQDDELVEARVMQLANAAFAGDTEVLAQLLDVLNDYPGCASAWRLLGTLAPLFDRRDLAYRAAATEPWSPFDSVERATYVLARRALRDGKPEIALQKSVDLPAGTSQTINLQVAALAALGQAEAALDVLDEFLKGHPDDRVAVFNRALLLREYLRRAEEAVPGLKRFLELEKAQGGSDLLRRMQAELWLGRGPQV